MQQDKILRPDSKGRICLGALAQGISGYKAIVDEETMKITLTPYAEVPLSERWLFQNKEALQSVRSGLKESSQHKTVDLGSFAKYTKEDQQ